MPPLASVILFAGQELLKEAPQAFAAIAAVFARKDVTVADLEKLRADLAAERYEHFVPQTQLPPSASIKG